MKLVFTAVWLLTALLLFTQFPADEAAVRTLLLAITYALAYGVVRLVMWFARCAVAFVRR